MVKDMLRRWGFMVIIAGLYVVFVPLLRVRVRGRERLPKRGPVVLAPNHRSSMDPIALAVAVRRPIAFLAKAELFKPAAWGAFMRSMLVVPIRRGTTDRTALRGAVESLKKGLALCVFLEGTRQTGPALGRPHPGAATIALLARAPIVPVAIAGTEGFATRKGLFSPLPRVSVSFGEPLYPRADAEDRHEEIARLTEETMASIAAEGGFPR